LISPEVDFPIGPFLGAIQGHRSAERRDHDVDSLQAGDRLAGVLYVYFIGESLKLASVFRRTGESG
jgi:hypothetical protein